MMRGAELYDRVVNWPNPMQLALVFAAGAVLIMTATLLLSLGRLRVFARVLSILGVVAIMLAMFVIHEQTIRTKVGEYITVTGSRYPQPTRFQIRVALLGLPAARLWSWSGFRTPPAADSGPPCRSTSRKDENTWPKAPIRRPWPSSTAPWRSHPTWLMRFTTAAPSTRPPERLRKPWQTSIRPCAATLSMRSPTCIVAGSVARRETSIPHWQTSIR